MPQARISEAVKSDLEGLIKKKNKKDDRKNVSVNEIIADLIKNYKEK